MTDGWVRLGEDVNCESCIMLWDVDCTIDGAVGVAGVADKELDTAPEGACEPDDADGALAEGPDDTAAAAAVAYRIAGSAAGGRGAEGSPTLSMLDIGCCAKFGFGGGLGAFSATIEGFRSCRPDFFCIGLSSRLGFETLSSSLSCFLGVRCGWSSLALSESSLPSSSSLARPNFSSSSPKLSSSYMPSSSSKFSSMLFSTK